MKTTCAHLTAAGALAALLLAVTPGAAQLKLNVDPLPRFEPNMPPNVRQVEIPPAAPELRAPLFLQGQNRIIVNGGQVIVNGMMPIELQPAGAAEAEEQPDPTEPHRIEFADGTWMHGLLDGFDTARQELTLRRMDASGPLIFPLAQISRLLLDGAAKEEPAKVHAMVKLTGGDWLGADVTAVQGDKLQLKLGDGSPLTVDRGRVEWIYFSKDGAAECYDGPTSFSGFESPNAAWTFRDGVLRATSAAILWRRMGRLPDQVEYLFEINQGVENCAFQLALHTESAATRAAGRAQIQLMLLGDQLQLWSNVGGNAKVETVNLSRIPGASGKKKAVQFRVLEDHPGGRLLVFIDGVKAADWTIGKGQAGENWGGFSFQPMAWSSNREQSISRIRILPWDGRVPAAGEGPETAATDRVSLVNGEQKTGTLEALTAEHVNLRTSRGVVTVPRAQVALVSFRQPKKASEEDAPAARIWMAQRGEFDATTLSFRDGKIHARTTFGGELALSPAAVRSVEFSGTRWTSPKPADVLVFKNGGQLRGALDAVPDAGKVRWRMGSDAPIEMKTTRLAGVLLAPREEQPPAKAEVLARFRNGDLLAGRFVSLDKECLVLDTAEAGKLTIAHAHLQTLYFATDGRPPVLDGAGEPEAWLQTIAARTAGEKPARPTLSGPWQYFDGSFTFARRPGRVAGGNVMLSRTFEAMPARVEFSFEVSSRSQPPAFSAQLFAESGKAGYMLQFNSRGVQVYDQGPRPAGRAFARQEFPFADKMDPAVRHRRIRLLADRSTGKLTVMVDGVVLGQFGPKSGERNLGRDLTLYAQVPCTIANLWVAPWDGQVPGRAPSPETAPPHVVLLANGDEARGSLELATPEVMKFESELGLLELPTPRLTMLDLGGEPIEPSGGTRLRFGKRGVLTVKSCRVENGTATCESEVAGTLTLSLASVQEIVFASQ